MENKGSFKEIFIVTLFLSLRRKFPSLISRNGTANFPGPGPTRCFPHMVYNTVFGKVLVPVPVHGKLLGPCSWIHLVTKEEEQSIAKAEDLKAPEKPSFCSEEDTTQYIFDGCMVQVGASFS